MAPRVLRLRGTNPDSEDYPLSRIVYAEDPGYGINPPDPNRVYEPGGGEMPYDPLTSISTNRGYGAAGYPMPPWTPPTPPPRPGGAAPAGRASAVNSGAPGASAPAAPAQPPPAPNFSLLSNTVGPGHPTQYYTAANFGGGGLGALLAGAINPRAAPTRAGPALQYPSPEDLNLGGAAQAPNMDDAELGTQISRIVASTGSLMALVQSYTGHYGNTATAGRQPFNGIVIHVTGKPDLQSELDFMRNPAGGGGYLGYHFLVDRDGTVYQTAPFDARTNHILPDKDRSYANNNSLGIALVGAAKGSTPAQMAAAKALVDSERAQFNIPANRVVGHGEIQTDRGEGSNLNPDGGAEGKDFLNFYRGGAQPAPASAAPVLAGAVARPGQGQPANPSNSIFDGLVARGFTAPQAYALMGNMKQESNFSPGANNPKEGAFGLLQWRLDRRANLDNFAAAQGKPANDLNTQLDFIKYEMTKGAESKNAAAFLASNDVGSANTALHQYIRYGDNTEGTRLANAQAYASGKDAPAGGGGAVASSAPAQPVQPDDWQSILGAEAPPTPPDLGSILGSAAQPMSTGLGGAGGGGMSGGEDDEQPIDLPVTSASAPPDEISARYEQSKPTRRAMAPLSDLFTIATIGQPGGAGRAPSRFT